MRKIFTIPFFTLICLIVSCSINLSNAKEFNQFEKDKFECHVIANSECYANLIEKYHYNNILKNILTYDYAFALAREKDYKKAIKNYKYVLENEKEIQDLINVADKQLTITNEIVKNMKISKRKDKGNYFNPEYAEHWSDPHNLKFYFESDTGKEYLFKNAINIYNNTFKGKLKLTCTSNPNDANVKVYFVNYISDDIWASSLKNYDENKQIKNAIINISLKRDKTFNNPDVILELISLNIIGKTLGLPDSNNPNDIMYTNAYKCFRKNDFSKRDKNTLLKIYK